MKSKWLILAFFVVYYIKAGALFNPRINECKDEKFKKNLTCVKNDDNSLNVTFDCILNNQEVFLFQVFVFENIFSLFESDEIYFLIFFRMRH